MIELIYKGWYENTPKDWDIERIKNIMIPKEGKSLHGEEELLSVTINNGVQKRKDYLQDDEGGSRSDTLIGYKIVDRSDLVNNIMKMSFRCLGISKYNGIVSPAYSVFCLNKEKIYPEYLNYLLRINRYISEFRKLSKGIQESRMRLYDDYFLAMKVIVPTINEQKLISKYLNNKTKEIDFLIEKLEKKTELLNEKKTALINQYTTKGINANVDMKDSGVDWIGDIPEKWFLGKLRWFINSIKDGTHGSHLSVDEGHLLLSGKNVHDGFLKIKDDERRISHESHLEITKNGFPKRGDVLVSCVGSIGRSCVYELDETISFQRSVCFIRPSERIDSYFLSYLIRSKSCQGQLITLTNQSTIGGVYMSDILDLVITIPTIQEQKDIVKSLDLKVNYIDLLILKHDNKIELLNEYRQSLISSVVTGKIRITEDMV